MDDAPRFVAIDQEAEFRALLECVPELPQQLRTALEAVPVSRDGSTVYRPCEVELDDGQVVDGVYLVEARSYFSKWGVAPWNDSWKRHVPVEHIRDLRDSSTRLPPAIADELYEHGEDGMGYCVFELVLANGRVLACQTGNAVDFVALPDGVRSDQVVEVRPGQGRGREPDCRECRYAWSLYQDETTQPDLPLYPPRGR